MDLSLVIPALHLKLLGVSLLKPYLIILFSLLHLISCFTLSSTPWLQLFSSSASLKAFVPYKYLESSFTITSIVTSLSTPYSSAPLPSFLSAFLHLVSHPCCLELMVIAFLALSFLRHLNPYHNSFFAYCKILLKNHNLFEEQWHIVDETPLAILDSTRLSRDLSKLYCVLPISL
jgi:hypothetical protein